MRSLHADVARAVVDAIEAAVTPAEAERLARTPDVVPEAYEAYQLGRFHWNRRTGEELGRARDCFEKALRLDPEYAEAHAGLADCYVLFPITGIMRPLEASRLTRDAARQALANDSSLAEAHAALAYALMLYEWDWDGAERAFQQALDLNPNYGTAHFHYAAYLAAVGRTDEAIREALRAQEVDPVSPIINAGVAWMHHLASDDQEVIAWARRALDLEPDFAIGHMRLGIAYQHLGRHAAAIASLERAVETSGHEWMPDLGHAYAVDGRREAAVEVLEELETISQRRYVPAYGFATIHAGLGDDERALEWLQRAFDERSWDMAFIRVEREMDPLRTDPRFQDIVRRMDFPRAPDP